MMKNLENYTNDLENLVKERTQQLEVEQAAAENLLLELLPKYPLLQNQNGWHIVKIKNYLSLQINREWSEIGQTCGTENIQTRDNSVLGYRRIHESLLGKHSYGGMWSIACVNIQC